MCKHTHIRGTQLHTGRPWCDGIRTGPRPPNTEHVLLFSPCVSCELVPPAGLHCWCFYPVVTPQQSEVSTCSTSCPECRNAASRDLLRGCSVLDRKPSAAWSSSTQDAEQMCRAAGLQVLPQLDASSRCRSRRSALLPGPYQGRAGITQHTHASL